MQTNVWNIQSYKLKIKRWDSVDIIQVQNATGQISTALNFPLTVELCQQYLKIVGPTKIASVDAFRHSLLTQQLQKETISF